MVKKELQQWLDNFNNVVVPALIKSGFKPNAINAREGLANITKDLVTTKYNVEQVLDDIIENDEYNLPVRIYNPSPKEELPVILFFHGGGHMAGSVSVYDSVNRRIALETNCIVVAPEYRLSPENPYPSGINDGVNAVKHVFDVLDLREIKYLKKLYLIGDSGGGAMVATLSMLSQEDAAMNIEKQALIYPSLDYTMSFPSIEENAAGYLLASAKVTWYFDNYFQNNEDRKKASPIFGSITDKMPQTQILTAQYCPLRDEGMEYGKKLKEVGRLYESYNFDNMIHTFVNMEDLCIDEVNLVYKKLNKFINS